MLIFSVVYFSKTRVSPSGSLTSMPTANPSQTTSSTSSSTPSTEPVVNQSSPQGVADQIFNCTGSAAGFVRYAAPYVQMGYPSIYYGDWGANQTEPPYVNFINGQNGERDILLGYIQAPLFNACRSLELAATALHINSSDYKLESVQCSRDKITSSLIVYDISPAETQWTLYMAKHFFFGSTSLENGDSPLKSYLRA